jgi:putative nucleotidyltransferase with HDIG domain
MDISFLEKQYIESGTYKISKTTNEVFEAILGTCVGIAIVDRNAKIGGLYHILLPEHPSGSGPFSDEVYADRGLPKFLQELYENGCTPGKMEAVLAGGALIGQLSRLDMDLDVGGRTIDIVTKILKENEVQIIQSETGGFFGTRLQLNLKELLCKINPAYVFSDSSKDSVKKISEDELAMSISRINPIPQIALKIIRTFQSENYTAKDIGAQIRQDQVISAKVLQICNSVYVNAKKEIKSIDQAIIILGAQIVIHLVLASALENFLKSSCIGYSMSKGGVFHHAISAAIVSEHISKFTGKSEPDIAYTGGLLHDIGKVLLDQYVGLMIPHFYREVYANGTCLVEAEKSMLGISHTEAGEKLARLWAFPDALIDVVAYHDRPELARNDPTLTYVVYLANLLLSRFDTCHELERIDTKPFRFCLQQLGLEAHSFQNLISSIPWKTLNSPGYF